MTRWVCPASFQDVRLIWSLPLPPMSPSPRDEALSAHGSVPFPGCWRAKLDESQMAGVKGPRATVAPLVHLDGVHLDGVSFENSSHFVTAESFRWCRTCSSEDECSRDVGAVVGYPSSESFGSDSYGTTSFPSPPPPRPPSPALCPLPHRASRTRSRASCWPVWDTAR